MNAITYKYALILSKKSLLLASMLVMLGAFAFSNGTASAASQTYAISCGRNNDVKISGSKVSCEKKGSARVTVQGVGEKDAAAQAGQSYPDSVPLTLVVVECGSNSNADLKLGGPIDRLTCASGSPKVRLQRVSPNPIPAAKESDRKVGTYKLDSAGNTTGGDDLKALSKTDPCGGKDCKDPAADPTKNCEGNEDCNIIAKYLNPLIKLFSYIFGLLAVISLIVGGITYSASAGDPQKVTAAKKRIINTVLAVVAYFFLFSFLQFLVPGGLF